MAGEDESVFSERFNRVAKPRPSTSGPQDFISEKIWMVVSMKEQIIFYPL